MGTSPSANGYFIDQFLNPLVRLSTDGYAGSIEARNRFALEISRATAAQLLEVSVLASGCRLMVCSMAFLSFAVDSIR